MSTTVFGNPRNRVLQLDGYLLDGQIATILQTQLTDAFADSTLPLKVQRIGSRHGNDLLLALKLILFKLFVWDKSTTYGLILQNLKLSNDNKSKKLTNIAKILILLNIISSHLLEKLSSYLYSGDANSLRETYPTLHSILQKLANYLPLIEIGSHFTDLANSVAFFTLGDYTSLFYRIFRIRHERLNHVGTSYASNPQTISYEFQDRQLIWNAFTEFVVNIQDVKMPKFLINAWKVALRRVMRREKTVSEEFREFEENHDLHDQNEAINDSNSGKSIFKFLPIRCCAISYSMDPNPNKTVDDNLVTNPYITSCGHIYSYFCLMNAMNNSTNTDDYFDNDDSGVNSGKWRCLRCGESVEWCKIYTEGMEDIKKETSDYLVSDNYKSFLRLEEQEDIDQESVNNEGSELKETKSGSSDHLDESEVDDEGDDEDNSGSESGLESGSDSDSEYEYDEDEFS